MSKVKLTVGLVLASLAGASGALRADNPDLQTVPKEHQVWDGEIGDAFASTNASPWIGSEHQAWDGEFSDPSWTTSKPAEVYAKKLLRTYQYADAWVVQHDDEDDKLYYVRFKIKGSIDDPPASPNPPASPDPTPPPTTGPDGPHGPGTSVPGPDGPDLPDGPLIGDPPDDDDGPPMMDMKPGVAPPDDDDPAGGGDEQGGDDPAP